MSASNTSREHEITTGPTGMLTVSGGKLTSSRLMAKQLVDAAQEALRPTGSSPARGARALLRSERSVAARTSVSGGDRDGARSAHDAAARAGVPQEIADAWVTRYGSNAAAVLGYWQADDANHEVIGVRGLTRAELAYLVEHEMVQTLEDLLVRRTSAFFWDASGGLDAVDAVADELETRLGWAPGRKDDEIRRYAELVRKHRPGAAPIRT